MTCQKQHEDDQQEEPTKSVTVVHGSPPERMIDRSNESGSTTEGSCEESLHDLEDAERAALIELVIGDAMTKPVDIHPLRAGPAASAWNYV